MEERASSSQFAPLPLPAPVPVGAFDTSLLR